MDPTPAQASAPIEAPSGRPVRASLPPGGFIARNIAEIGADRALRAYGACLSVSYLATAFFMLWRKQYAYLTSATGAVCWPLLPECYRYHVLTTPEAIGALVLLGALAVAMALSFLAGRAKAGWWLLFATFALEGLIVAQDFRFRMNQHYMLLWATAVLLFVPYKRLATSFMVVSFYFWAGHIKLNVDWLSGWELPPHRLWLIPDSLYPAACIYVVVLEMVLVWGLVQPRKWLFWAVFAQFVLFHALSWSIINFFFPIVMIGIVSIFPLRQIFPEPPRDDLSDFVHLRLPKPIYALLAVFGLLQFVPLLYPGDSAWTFQGRLFSLHMFKGRSWCRAWAEEKFTDRPPVKVGLFRGELDVLERCDPLVYFDGARELCRTLPQQAPSFVDLDLHMLVAKRTAPAWQPLIDTQDFCSKHLRYNPFLPNDWILPAQADSASKEQLP